MASLIQILLSIVCIFICITYKNCKLRFLTVISVIGVADSVKNISCMLRKKYENCYVVLWTMDYKRAIVGCLKVLLLVGTAGSHGKFSVVSIAAEY